MSEGNKLPALSLEVKALNYSTMKWYSVTFGASRFFVRKRRSQEQVFEKETEIIVYHCLLSEWKTKMVD